METTTDDHSQPNIAISIKRKTSLQDVSNQRDHDVFNDESLLHAHRTPKNADVLGHFKEGKAYA